MKDNRVVEIDEIGRDENLVENILAGQVVHLRRGLQQVGLFDKLVEASLDGIKKGAGQEAADRTARDGFDRVHEWADPPGLPALTDAVYAEFNKMSADFIDTLVTSVFPDAESYYFETSPNVRFHVPFDLVAPHQKAFGEFARYRGEGKISAHGPHRDSWVDCPENCVNLWIAVGPVRHGNGLSIFLDDYKRQFPFESGYLVNGYALHEPANFDMEPGDVLMFHGGHVHGSELNRIDATRYVVSCRITFGKPRFPFGHYHHYRHGGWAKGPLANFAELPANFQASFLANPFRLIKDKLTGTPPMTGKDGAQVDPPDNSTIDDADEFESVSLDDLPVGAIRPVSKTVCVARLDENRIVAVGRRCPHMGGDLAGGWVADGSIVCPHHNLTFNPDTGASPCKALRSLRQYSCEIEDGRISVKIDDPSLANAG